MKYPNGVPLNIIYWSILYQHGQRFSLKQWFAGGAQSRGLRKPGCGHRYLRFFIKMFIPFPALRLLQFDAVHEYQWQIHCVRDGDDERQG